MVRVQLRHVAVGAVVVGCLAASAVGGAGYPERRIDQVTGTAWVASPAQGLVSLIDGATGQITAAVRVPVPGGALDVEQAGASAYLADVAAGTVSRIDGAIREPGTPVVLGTRGADLQVLQGAGTLEVVDAGRRVVRRVDPVTLRPRSEVSLASAPGPGQAVVDDDGVLWVVDSAHGGATRFGAGKRSLPGAAGRDDTLVLVQGHPVVVDRSQGRLVPLGADGTPGEPGCLDVRTDDDAQILGSRTRPEVYAAVAETGSLLIAATDRDDCARSVAVAEPATARFTALAQSDHWVFVPDDATGTISVVDLRTARKVDELPLTEPGTHVQLLAKDGLVFYHELDGTRAGVLTMQGGIWTSSEAVSKYDPTTGEATAELNEPAEKPNEAPAAQDQAPSDATTPSSAPTTPPPSPPSSGAPGGGQETRPRGTGTQGPPTSLPSPGPPTPPPVPPAPPVPTVPTVPTIDSIISDAPSDASPEYLTGSSATFTAVVSGFDAAATWMWSATSSAVDVGPTYATPAPGAPFVLQDVGQAGDVVVTLTITEPDGTTATRSRQVLVTDSLCFIEISTLTGADVDLTTGPETLTVTARDCRRDQPFSVDAASWLTIDGPRMATAAGTALQVSEAAVPPGGVRDGTDIEPGSYRLRFAGAVTVTMLGDGPHSAYPADVLTDAPPLMIGALACVEETGATQDAGGGVILTEYRKTLQVDVIDDADHALALTVTTDVGDTILGRGPGGGSGETTYYDVSTGFSLTPPPWPTTATATDANGRHESRDFEDSCALIG